MSDWPATPPTVAMIEQNCFLVTCRDKEGVMPIRQKYMAEHLANAEKNWSRFLTAGPLKKPGSDETIGSLFLVFADSAEEARQVVESDPYFEHDIYESVEVLQLINAMGQFIGGKVWP